MRACAADDCDRLFPTNGRADQRYCSNVCQIRTNKRRRLRRDPYANVDLAALREAAIHELVHGALEGGDGALMARAASVVVAVEQRLERPS